jgi:hypothetical protein
MKIIELTPDFIVFVGDQVAEAPGRRLGEPSVVETAECPHSIDCARMPTAACCRKASHQC